ncbi:peptide chain release factor 2 [Buchnera aphidicola]|uniref:peptide chain release factor 2 n=1 Tax=Buchnera aphidicola TaxID=9 RepID=UPI003463ADCB
MFSTINVCNKQLIQIQEKIIDFKKKIRKKKEKKILQKDTIPNHIHCENNYNIKKKNEKNKNIFNIIQEIERIEKILYETKELINISLELKDTSIIPEIIQSIKNIKNKFKKIKIKYIFRKKYDSCNCYLDIHSGSGGIDAQDWSKMLLRMYLKWIDKKKFKIEIIQELYGEIAGIKSATIRVIGKYAFGWLRTETGIHRLIRKSPFNSGNRRHTSFSSAFIYPEVENAINIKMHPSELRIDVYRASGAGGQHVNRTESAVRITHLPTSTVTQCQNERSQHKNKEQAMKQMQVKLYKIELEKKNAEKQNIEKNKSSICWGNQIRSYILDHSLIKDIRTGIETRNIQSVLNGNLDIFIEKSLKMGL